MLDIFQIGVTPYRVGNILKDTLVKKKNDTDRARHSCQTSVTFVLLGCLLHREGNRPYWAFQ